MPGSWSGSPERPTTRVRPGRPEASDYCSACCTQESGATVQGGFNLTENGKKIMANAIKYLLGIMEERAASGPIPGDGAVDVRRDAVLTWTSGKFAATEDVYFGTNPDDVAGAGRALPLGVLVSQGQDANTYDPAGLFEFGQTYYWRIDEVNAPPDSTIDKGPVWSFTAEPVTYPVTKITASASSVHASFGPENTINGSGLDENDRHSMADTAAWLTATGAALPAWIQYEFDRVYKLDEMWVWNYNTFFEPILGLGLKDVAVEYSVNGTDWTSLGDLQFAQAPAANGYDHNTTVDFAGVAARYVRLTAKSNWGSSQQFGLSEVRFLYIPSHAREPIPASGATGVNPDVTLSWRAGREAVSHKLYLGTDRQAVADGTVPAATPGQASYAPSSLEFGATYYWKVVEVNDAASPAAWESDIWNFSTAEYLAIEDFESYTNESPNAALPDVDRWLRLLGGRVLPDGQSGQWHGLSRGTRYLDHGRTAVRQDDRGDRHHARRQAIHAAVLRQQQHRLLGGAADVADGSELDHQCRRHADPVPARRADWLPGAVL